VKSQLEQIIEEFAGLSDRYNNEGEALETESLECLKNDSAKSVVLGRQASFSFGIAKGIKIALSVLKQKRFELEENK